MQTRILSGTNQGIQGLSIAKVLETIRTKSPAVSHALLIAAIPSFRAITILLFRTNVLGLATLLQFLFDKQPDQKTKFIDRWYMLGGEKSGSKVIEAIKTGSAKKGLLNITKVINKINQVRSQNTSTVIGCVSCGGQCNKPQLGAMRGIGGPSGTPAEEASTAATILAVVDFLTKAIDIWKQYAPNQDGDEKTPNGNGGGNDDDKPKKEDNTILYIALAAVAGFGIYSFAKK